MGSSAAQSTGPGGSLGGGSTTPPYFVPPNVVLIVADDLGVDMLNCYHEGNDLPTTPNIDKLAQTGLLFRNAWSSPVCSPSRGSLQTGRYPFRFDMKWIINASSPKGLPDSEWTVPEVLSALAPMHIDTAQFGKWHLTPNTQPGVDLAPNTQGYEHFDGTLFGFWKVPPNGYFYLDYNLVDGIPTTVSKYNTVYITDQVINWWSQTSGPRFAHVAYNAPHSPYQTPPPWMFTVDLSNLQPGEIRPVYKAMLEALDHEVGRLVKAIRLASPDAIIVFCGDNGTPIGVPVAPFSSNKCKETTFEGGVNVPLIINGPIVASPGREENALVSLTDVFATVMDLQGVDRVALANLYSTRELDSVSLLPYLVDPTSRPLRDMVYTECEKPLFGGAVRHEIATRNLRYKLRRVIENSQHDEFYDLLVDPFELNDLKKPGAAPLTQAQQVAFHHLLVFMQHPH